MFSVISGFLLTPGLPSADIRTAIQCAPLVCERIIMSKLRKLMAAVLLAGAAALPVSSANAFWGGDWMPWDWFDDDWDDYPYWGAPWGYPGYGYGYPLFIGQKVPSIIIGSGAVRHPPSPPFKPPGRRGKASILKSSLLLRISSD